MLRRAVKRFLPDHLNMRLLPGVLSFALAAIGVALGFASQAMSWHVVGVIAFYITALGVLGGIASALYFWWQVHPGAEQAVAAPRCHLTIHSSRSRFAARLNSGVRCHMTVRKHVTEIAFNLASQGTLLIHPKDINKLDGESGETRELAEQCHIYIIAKRPRLSFVPNSINWSGGTTHGKMSFVNGGNRQELSFTMQGEPALDIQYGDYPHRTIDLLKDGEVIYTLPAHMMPCFFASTDTPSIKDLEVVYVGMSYGGGNRSAKDRLKGHSTLQQVLADLNAEEPDMEALIVMVQYAPPISIISFDGRDKTLDIDSDRNAVADMRAADEIITKKIETALSEAALIRYFQPAYNEKYKNNFPSTAHTVTESLYSIDFLAFVVELDTEDIHVRLFSGQRKPGYHHIANFDLHDPSERKSFFNMLESSPSYNAESMSGPIY